MNEYFSRAEVIMQRINELASVTEDEGCITRNYGTPAFIEGRKKVETWMKEAGLSTFTDTIGNIRGRISSRLPNAKTLVIGSHIDTVVNAGRFDGPLGVLMGVEMVKEFSKSRDLPFNVEVIGFCDEEGCRFHTTYLGSKAVCGSLDTAVLGSKDNRGVSLKDVIAQSGGDVNKINNDNIPASGWRAYFEIHIEQGPVLYEKDIPVGIVTAIAGQRRASLTFIGEAGHAGTVPMDMRKDALAAAATFIIEAEKYAGENKESVVTTVGKLNIENSASNVIPGKVNISLDIRSADDAILSTAYASLRTIAESICKKRGIELNWELIQQSKPVHCDDALNRLLENSIANAGYETVRLVSGAGHDAVPVSEVSPVAMLFVRCFKGISHNPLEDVELKDLAAALKVSDNFIRQLIIHNS
jgi:allantoate deiminase